MERRAGQEVVGWWVERVWAPACKRCPVDAPTADVSPGVIGERQRADLAGDINVITLLDE
jgi:hypothetical protein